MLKLHVYGPYIAVLYSSNAALAHVKPVAHFFNPTKTFEDTLGFAASKCEGFQVLPFILKYLEGSDDAVTDHPGKLQKILLDFLNERDSVTVLGSTSADSMERVPTISFVIEDISPKTIVVEAEKISNCGFRWGHFYSKRLCDELLGLGPEGVTRVSMEHYKTEEEIHRLFDVLKKVLPNVWKCVNIIRA
jgi:selenocysteine lyase/cysteine desulfurase